MAKYITSIAVSLNRAEEENLLAQHFFKLDVNLSLNSGNPVYIWYKQESGSTPITRIQVSYEDEMCSGLIKVGYVKVDGSLATRPAFLWYLKGSTPYDTGIVDLQISNNADEEASKMKNGLERVGRNLSKSYGNRQYLWMKREKPTYICDVDATTSFGSDADYFKKGYIRIDESTNTERWKNSSNFLWYRLTTDAKSALTDVKVSTSNSDFAQYQAQGYNSVSANLNDGTGGNQVYLWYKKVKGQGPMRSMLLLTRGYAIQPFEKAGISVIPNNINSGNDGPERFLCVLKQYEKA